MTTTFVDEEVEVTEDTVSNNGWKVIIHNNDYTPFDLVIIGLITIFDKTMDQAKAHAMETHKTGSSVVATGLTQEDAVVNAGKFRIFTKDFGRLPPCLATAEEDT